VNVTWRRLSRPNARRRQAPIPVAPYPRRQGPGPCGRRGRFGAVLVAVGLQGLAALLPEPARSELDGDLDREGPGRPGTRQTEDNSKKRSAYALPVGNGEALATGVGTEVGTATGVVGEAVAVATGEGAAAVGVGVLVGVHGVSLVGMGTGVAVPRNPLVGTAVAVALGLGTGDGQGALAVAAALAACAAVVGLAVWVAVAALAGVEGAADAVAFLLM